MLPVTYEFSSSSGGIKVLISIKCFTCKHSGEKAKPGEKKETTKKTGEKTTATRTSSKVSSSSKTSPRTKSTGECYSVFLFVLPVL